MLRTLQHAELHEHPHRAELQGYGGFLKLGVPPNHPFINGFSLINHPFGGTSLYGNPHMSDSLGPGNFSRTSWHSILKRLQGDPFAEEEVEHDEDEEDDEAQ